jgi:23S rRNA (uracil1939-C5)-methyltransferase
MQTAWLTVESLDLEAQGVARPTGARRRQGGLHRRRLARRAVQVQVHRRKNNWEQGQMTALRARAAQRVRPGCPHFGLHAGACGGCKMQHLHPRRRWPSSSVCWRTTSGTWPRCGPSGCCGRSKGRPGATATARACRCARGQEGHGAGRLSRAQVALRGRHAGVPGAAAARQRHADAAARADRRDGPARPPAADRAGRGRRGHRAGAAPPGAAVRRRPRRLRAFGAEHGVQWWLQPKGPDTVHLLDEAGPRWPTRCPSSASPCPSSRPTSRRSTRTSTACWWARALRLLAPQP